MRAILIIAAIVAILALIGWISFGSRGDRASINVETDRVRQDTSEAVERGEELIDETRREIRQARERREERIDDDAEGGEPVEGDRGAAARPRGFERGEPMRSSA